VDHTPETISQSVVLLFLQVHFSTWDRNRHSQLDVTFLATYHHFEPRTVGANAVSWFWGLMTIGCLLDYFC